MERAEKRKLERERQKLNKHNLKEDAVNLQWYRQLPVSRKIFLGKLYEAKIIENDNVVAMIMDKCILAAMDDNTDLSIILMKKIIKEYNDYILEYKEYLDKYGNGGMDMIENVKIREEVKGKMKVMITDGLEKVKGMAKLKKEYNLPAAELSELWIDCKAELNQEKKLKNVEKNIETEKALDKYINEKLEFKDQSDTKIGTVTASYDTDKGFKIEVEPVGLQVVDEVKVVKGKFGYYHKSKDGIRFSNDEKLINDDVAYKNKDEVKNKRNELINEYLDRVKVLNKQLEEINRQLEYANKANETMNHHFDEIEQVFDL